MRVFVLMSVWLIIATTACKSVQISERGISGGSFLSTSPAKPGKKHSHQPFIDKSNFAASSPTKSDSAESKAAPHVNHLASMDKKPSIHAPNRLKALPLKHVIKNTKAYSHSESALQPHKDNPDEGSLRWMLYLILCFLVPPLAYFLIKRQTDTLFWVCFFCYLLTITFFGGFRLGLLGLLSIVIALLTLFQIEI